MRTVLITGAAGHLGRRITRRLAADGFAVRAMVRRPVSSWPAGVTELVADVAHDRDALRKGIDGTDAVIHLAGASEEGLRADPGGAFADSLRAAEHVADSDASRIIYLSTVHVYGENLAPGAVVGESTPPAPRTDYARARLACEDAVRSAPTRTVIFRVTNGIGAPVDAARSGWQVVSNDLFRCGATEGRLVLHTSGQQWRDFVPLVDVETALGTLIGTDAPITGTYNFGAGESITVRTLAEEIRHTFAQIEGVGPTLEIPPSSPDPPPDAYRVDVAALRALNLFVPTTRAQAIGEVVNDCLLRRAALREQ